MNIEEIDRLDAHERYQEMKDQLDELDNSDNDFSDVDLSYSDGEEATRAEVNDDNRSQHNLSSEFDVSYAEEQELEELRHYKWQDESDTILNLVRTLTERNADFRTMELRYNHVKLQNDALIQQERSLRESVHRLEFEGAIAEENLILLEEKMRKISNFEEGPERAGEYSSIDMLRGKLLTASAARVEELEDTLQQVRAELEDRVRESEEVVLELRTECAALREEAESLATQLAQRTVLYSAQERRYYNEQRMWRGNKEAQADEIIHLRARLQQMEAQCAQLDRERIAAVLENREIKVSYSELNKTAGAESARLVESEQELLAAMELNQSLQETISRLRGADVEDIEREMAQEVETIRNAAQQREEELRLQLENARDMLRGDGGRMSDLEIENARLVERVAGLEELLREIKDHSGFGLSSPSRQMAHEFNDVSAAVVSDSGTTHGGHGQADVLHGMLGSHLTDQDKSLSLIMGDEEESSASFESIPQQPASSVNRSTVSQISVGTQVVSGAPSTLSPADALGHSVLLRDLLKIVLYSCAESTSRYDDKDNATFPGVYNRDLYRAVVRFVLGLKAPHVISLPCDGLDGYDDFSLTAEEQDCVTRFVVAVEHLLTTVPEAMKMTARAEALGDGVANPSRTNWTSLRDELITTYLRENNDSDHVNTGANSLRNAAGIWNDDLTNQTTSITTTSDRTHALSEIEWTAVHKELASLRKELKDKAQRLPALEGEIASLKEALELSRSESRNTSMSIVADDRDEWMSQMQLLDDRSKDLEQKSLLVLTRLNTVELEKSKLEREIESLRQIHTEEQAALMKDNSHLQERLQTFQTAIQSSADRMQSLEEERDVLMADVGRWRDAERSMAKEVSSLELDRSRLQQELEELRSSSSIERDALFKRVSFLEEELAEIKSYAQSVDEHRIVVSNHSEIETVTAVSVETSIMVETVTADKESTMRTNQAALEIIAQELRAVCFSMDQVCRECKIEASSELSDALANSSINGTPNMELWVRFIDDRGTALANEIVRLSDAIEASNTEKDALSEQIDKWQQAIDDYEVRVEVLRKERDDLIVSLRRAKEYPDEMSSGDEEESPAKVEKYGLLTSMIVENLENSIGDIDDHIFDIDKEVQLLTTRSDNLKKELSYVTAESEKETISIKLAQLDNEIQGYSLQKKELWTERQEIVSKLYDLRQELHQESEKHRISDEVDELQQSMRKSTVRIHDLEIERDELKASLDVLTKKTNAPLTSKPDEKCSQSKLRDDSVLLRTTQSLLENARADVKSLERQNTELVQQVSTLTEQFRNADRESRSLRADNSLVESKLQSSLVETKQRIDMLTDDMEALRQIHTEEQAALMKDNSHLQERLQTFQTAIQSSADRMQSLEEERDVLMADVGRWRDAERSMAKEVSSLELDRSRLQQELETVNAKLALALEKEHDNLLTADIERVMHQLLDMTDLIGENDGVELLSESDNIESRIESTLNALKNRVLSLMKALEHFREECRATCEELGQRTDDCEKLRQQLEEAMSKHDELVECIKDIDEDRDAILSKIEGEKRAAEKLVNGKMEALQNELALVTEKCVLERSRVLELEDEISRLRSLETCNKNPSRDEELDELRQERDKLLDDIDVLTVESSRRVSVIEVEMSSLCDEISTLQKKCGSLERQLEEQVELNALNKGEHDTSNTSDAAENTANDSLVEEELRVLKEMCIRGEVKIKELQQQIQEHKEEKDVLVGEVKSLNKQIAVAGREKDDSLKRLKAMEGKWLDIQEQLRAVEEEREVVVDELRRRSTDAAMINTLQREKEEMSIEIQTLKAAVVEYSEQIQTLEDDKRNITQVLSHDKEETARILSDRDHRITQLESDMLKSSTQIRVLEEERTALTRQLRGTWTKQVEVSDDLSTHLGHLQREFSSTSRQLEASLQKNQQLQEKVIILTEQIEIKDMQLSELSAKVESLLTDVAGKNDDNAVRLEKIQEEDLQLREQVRIQQEVAEKTAAERVAWINEKKELLNERDALVSEVSDLRVELDAVAGHWREEMTEAVKHVRQKAAEEAARMKTRLEAAHIVEIQALTQRIENQADASLQESNGQATQDIQTLRTALLDRENLITNLQNKLLDQQNVIDSLRQIETKRHDEPSIEDIKARLETEFQSRKAQLSETSQKVLNDRIREISQSLSVERERLLAELNDKNQTIAELSADMRGYGQRLQDKWKEARRNLKEKYNRRLEEAKKRYTEEVHALVNLVKAECTDIFSEVQQQQRQEEEEDMRYSRLGHSHGEHVENMPPMPPQSHAKRDSGGMGFEEGLLKSHQSSLSGWGSARLTESISSRRTGINGLVVAPEMLSPEETQELVRSILSRSTVASISVRPSDKSVVDSVAASSSWNHHRQQDHVLYSNSDVKLDGEMIRENLHEGHSEFARGGSKNVHSPSQSFSLHGRSVMRDSGVDSSGEVRVSRGLNPPSATFSPSFHSGSSKSTRIVATRSDKSITAHRQIPSTEEKYQLNVANRMERMISKLDAANK